MTAVLELNSVSISFGGVKAVQDVSLRLEAGDRRTVIGPNGAGKTTLFNLIAGQLRPDRGRVIVDGVDVTREPPYRRARRGLARTFQVSRLFRGLTVRQNLELALRGHDGSGLLEEWGLEASADARVEELSHGNQRLLDIVMALANRPKLLLLDEPTAGLSGSERSLVAAGLRRLPPEITLVLTDHDMDVVFDIADRITVLNYGEVAADGTPDEIRANEHVQSIYFE